MKQSIVVLHYACDRQIDYTNGIDQQYCVLLESN